jgi:hypothetical protein
MLGVAPRQNLSSSSGHFQQLIKNWSYRLMCKTQFSGPGRYRIKARGRLDADWNDRFGAMEVVSILSPCADDALTMLEGEVSDQAELAGILNTLYELHLPLLEVLRIEDEGHR